MLFSSISFLYYFLPVVIVLYFITPMKFKNFILLLVSLFFYFYGEPVFCIIMLISTFSGYLHGLWIDKFRNSKYKKIPLVSAIIVGLSFLLYYKYTDFFIMNVNNIFNTSFSLLRIALPIGISFYTFQILSYTIDVYRCEASVQKNFFNFATYVTFFPQLIAGPIVQYTTIEKQLNERTHTLNDFAYGVKRFIVGLAKKVLIANTLGELNQLFSDIPQKTVVLYWLVAIAFMLHIYFDFSGYSDMAIGLGKMFGFHFLENFNYPYISKSITEFWRRWHISLGSWFRNYVYIPLGGNRVSKWKWIRNILIVWFLTGFWHGASWNFIVWGLMFAVLLLMEKFFLNEMFKKLPSFLPHLYVIFFVLIGFVIFNSNTLNEGIRNLGGMFGFNDIRFINDVTIYYFRNYLFVLLIGIIGSTPLIKKFLTRLSLIKSVKMILDTLEPVLYITLLLMITGYLIDGSFNPFIYFRF